MELLKLAFEYILHIDRHLGVVVQDYGLLAYGVLFLIIFLETGLVVTPFLPGDSLLFAAGALAATTSLDPVWLFLLLTAAAILGDTANYWAGYKIGGRVFEKDRPLINEEYLKRTQGFYEKHGKKTIILARFVPIIRTFAPFIAGVGKMEYKTFLSYNIIGGIAWIGLFIFGGYFFGNIPIIKDNFGLVVIAIIMISVVPAVIELWKHHGRSKID
ncbi:MAG: membrane-associated protein [Parcubacteria group bacterium Gr01-1014_3]|nr:MAG: membrane-associated protein [Parcubacteria group bacterium Gr01-1014_3]